MTPDDKQTLLAMLLCLCPWLGVLVVVKIVSELAR
jgi:hypothetical protein